MKLPLGILAGVCLAAFSASDASAQSFSFQLCNKSSTRVYVAASYIPAEGQGDDPIYVTTGWWLMAVGECATLFQTSGQYVYLHGEVEGNINRGYFGEKNFCVTEKQFTNRKRASEGGVCENDYRLASFKEIDTGKEWIDPFTYTYKD